MSIAFLAVPGVLAPLQGLWRWLVPVTAQIRPSHSSVNRHVREVATHSITGNARYQQVELQNSSSPSVRRPLRIVRIMEAGQAPTHVGRMVISGRMADVCAELDRLAAREASLH